VAPPLLNDTMTQCLGRLVKDTPHGVNMLSFDQGGLFHLPLRCQTVTRSGDLCDNCSARERKTAEKLKDISGTTIGGPHPSYLMGRVTDPIPYWSRLYGSAWFNLKIESGCTISEENMQKVKKAVAKAYDGVEVAEAVPLPGRRKLIVPGGTKVTSSSAEGTLRKVLPGKKKLEQTPVAVPPAEPVAAPAKKRIAVKKTLTTEPVAKVGSEPINATEYDVLEVALKKREVDGRLFYLDSKKNKLYDTKFMYVGRLRGETIVAHPDSDAEAH